MIVVPAQGEHALGRCLAHCALAGDPVRAALGGGHLEGNLDAPALD